jgi:hypothetical protein
MRKYRNKLVDSADRVGEKTASAGPAAPSEWNEDTLF